MIYSDSDLEGPRTA